MFDNIGSKIKKLATYVSLAGIISCVVSGIIVMSVEEGGKSFLYGLAIAIIGSLLSWIGGFFTYGFGQLIENTDIIAANSEKKAESENQKKSKSAAEKKSDVVIASASPKKEAAKADAEEETEGYSDFECPECGEMLSFSAEEIQKGTELYCPFCNEKLYVRKN